jgi:hypothetical protein
VCLPEAQDEPTSASSAQHEVVSFPVNVNRATMEQNVATYEAMHGELVKTHLDQYVAICNGKLVDHDPDPLALLTRIRNEYPKQIVLRRKVAKTAKRELRIRHPKIERSS